MERMGFVAHIEEDLERTISQGRLPASGFLPSESLLARQYGVSRTTVREALLRLAARGLVVQHPGRKTRAVAMDVAVTLENLSVALHAEGPAHPERRRLLEGYLELKREMTVELLSACCERATQADLETLQDACFMLREEARWKGRPGWVEREFNLLRQAAIFSGRPGHFLLIQSLERSFWGMSGRLLPHLDGEAICGWAHAAFSALHDKDVQALKHQLAPLLQACDERLLRGLSALQDAARPHMIPLGPTELPRKQPSQEAPFPDQNSRPDVARYESSTGALFGEPRIGPETATTNPLLVEEVQELHSDLAAATGESVLAKEAQEVHTELEAVTCEPSLEQVQKVHAERESARSEPVSDAQIQEAHTEPGTATGEVPAEFGANLSACWTGSDKKRSAGVPPPASVPCGLGCPSSDTELGRAVSPAGDEEGEIGAVSEKP
ncbi:FadR/GntR family transcriptional regulator [Hyalangium minutum]|nr:GntR family transcriptional regulator [Hyalangium minutum]